MQKLFQFIAVLFISIYPTFAEAQTIGTLITEVQNLVGSLIPLLIGLGLIGFLYGLVIYIFKAGNEGEAERGKQIMFWGVIALFVMVSVWGIVTVLQTSLFSGTGIDPTQPPATGEFPTLPAPPPPPPAGP